MLSAMESIRTRQGFAYMLGGGALLGTLGVPLEEAGQHPLAAVWFRCAFGALVLGAALAARGELAGLRLHGRASAYAIAGALAMLLNWWLFFESIRRTSIALATVVFHVQPFVVMALGAWWFGERVRPLQWGATGVAVVGLALVAEVLPALAGGGGIGAREAWGLAMCLGAAVSYALVVVLAKLVQSPASAADGGSRPDGSRPPPGPLVLAWWHCAIGTVCLAWWPLRHGMPEAAPAWAWLAVLGVVNTGLAYTLLYAGIARLPAGRIALMQFVYPLVAVGVDALVYGRTLDAVQLAGLALMLAALSVAARPSR